MLKRFSFFLLCLTVIFASCSKDDDIKTNDYSKGIFIVNEGPFNSGTGTISYFNGDTVVNDLYSVQNPGRVLGNIGQSMIKFDNKYFIAVNNAAKIVVVDAQDFTFLNEIPVTLPRYFAVANGNLYVTSWTDDFSSGFINAIDTKNMVITDSEPVAGLVDKAVVKDGNIYAVVNASEGEPLSHHIVVYDASSKKISSTIKVGDNSNDITIDKNGNVWVLSSGFFNFTDPSLNTDGAIYKISGNTSEKVVDLPNGSNQLTIDKNKTTLYFLSGSGIQSMSTDNPGAGINEVYQGFFYKIAADPQADYIYAADPKDYQQAGNFLKINTQSKSTETYSVGTIPSFFYFSN